MSAFSDPFETKAALWNIKLMRPKKGNYEYNFQNEMLFLLSREN